MPATKDQYAQAYKKAKQFAPKDWMPKGPEAYQYSQSQMKHQHVNESEFDPLIEEELWNS